MIGIVNSVLSNGGIYQLDSQAYDTGALQYELRYGFPIVLSVNSYPVFSLFKHTHH